MFKKILCGILCFTVLCGAIACGIGGSTASEKDLVILDYHSTIDEWGTFKVVGTAQNTGGKTMEYAEVDVKFYDSAGNLLDTWIDNINNLGASETWNFEVAYLGSGTVGTYTIAPGTVW